MSGEQSSFEADIAQFIEYSNDIKNKEAIIKILKKESKEIETQILAHFSDTGISSVKMDGGTVYLHRQLWAGVDTQENEAPKDAMERAVKALREAGYEDLVSEKFSTQAVSAIVRELDKEGEDLPQEFEGAIRVAEKFSARLRRA